MSIDDGTRAAAEFSVHGVYQGTAQGLPEAHGQRYVLIGGVFFAVNQGKIARVTPYYNQHDRLAQISRG
jgi:steroid delta-isomerase-like uncharacterized protein